MAESVWLWSKTAADNNDADGGINWSEGQTPGSVNNSGRGMMAGIAKLRDDQGGALTSGGTSTAYTLTTNQGLAAHADGVRIHVVMSAVNLTAATLNVDGLGAKKIRKLGNAGDEALTGFELLKNGHYIFQYDASADAASGAWIVLNPNRPPMPGTLWGLTLSNGTDATNDIDIAAGSAADATNVVLMTLASALTKRLDASWAVGTGNGGLDTGSIADTTYHIWLIMRSDTGVVDALFSASASSPTMPANYDYKRRIGSIVRAGATILAFTQIGDTFELTTPVLDVSVTNLSTSSVTYTLASVPTGIVVGAILNLRNSHASSATSTYVRPLTATDAAPSTSAAPLLTLFCASGSSDFAPRVSIPTNTSAQIGARSSNSSTTLQIATLGWADTRGRTA